MGYFGEWVGYRSDSVADAAAALEFLSGEGYEPSIESEGWSWSYSPEGSQAEFGIHRVVAAVSRAARGPALLAPCPAGRAT